MSNKIFLFVVLLLLTYSAKAQVVYKTGYQTKADYLLYLTTEKWQADILVYWSKSKLRAKHDYQDGTWFKTEYKNQADVTISFTDYKTVAYLSIYIINDKFKAGAKSEKGGKWLNQIKKK